jgi:hypothetical protein
VPITVRKFREVSEAHPIERRRFTPEADMLNVIVLKKPKVEP